MTEAHKKVKDALRIAGDIQKDVRVRLDPPDEGQASQTDSLIPKALVRGTRGYIERVSNQANGCYERGWYDACAVMVRRLLETLIIEAFEHHKIGHTIQGADGEYVFLKDLIAAALNEKSWALGRATKPALGKLKTIGDQSAHSRRFVATRQDIDKLAPELRIVVQEFIYLAALK